ncbi:MAG TPA: DEAD/DEAH box helicase, partial [Thermococcus paralvinellae]|nr:DEAD/DEAH box helicase [Thermococcus paralvinellae]
MVDIKLKPDDIIEAPFLAGKLRVRAVQHLGDKLIIIGRYLDTNDLQEVIIKPSMLSQLKVIRDLLDFSGDPEDVFLAIESERYKFASMYDPLMAISVSKIDPLPFQIDAVYNYILKNARIRFLLADDPGAGKTIMAGLALKELKLRGLVERVLIVVPGHLVNQWRREMKEKFNEDFVFVNRALLNSEYNVWEKYDQVIASIDFLKQPDVLPTIQNILWDLVIVDEAHKMAAYKYGNKIEKTDRYRVGEVLSRNSTHMLFLTATPHKGDPENFRLLLDLLLPGLFGKPEYVEQAIREAYKKGENMFFLRRMKEDLRGFDGRPLFPKRESKTLKFRLSDEEMDLYMDLSQYIQHQYNRISKLQGKRRNIAFALTILQRRMASSTYALMKSLQRRKDRLKELLEIVKRTGKLPEEGNEITLGKFLESEDYEEKERWEIERRLETLSVARTINELKREIATLERLIQMANRIIQEEKEVKLLELKSALDKLKEEFGEKEKVLIFTEAKDTLEYLVNKLKDWGYTVTYIHGEMPMEERIKREREFRGHAQIMVATEAAGEGINLQFCHLMINYDIPWNPNRLEQRIGRIHRYGQKKDVYIFNLVAANTREGRVLSRLLDKLEQIREDLGSDKVFDVIGEIFQGERLYNLMLEVAAGTKTEEEVLKEIGVTDPEYIKRVKEALGESLATKHLNVAKIEEMLKKANENRLAPEYLQDFFIRAIRKAGGEVRVKRDGRLIVEKVPKNIRDIGKELGHFIQPSHITFDKDKTEEDNVEFVSFGHPLFDATLEWVRRNLMDALRRGAIFVDPRGRLSGFIMFFEGEVTDGKDEVAGKKLIAIYDDGESLREINPKVIWDLEPYNGRIQIKLPDSRKKLALEKAITILEEYQKQILQERKRQAEIKVKYGIKSLEELIKDTKKKLFQYKSKQLSLQKKGNLKAAAGYEPHIAREQNKLE